ncbi:MAG: class I SAM-dependent methyltransferase [Planctomycetes bacterium]|nr:class I SAM-dependent methyltransferase [Planctomycetota bacterium]
MIYDQFNQWLADFLLRTFPPSDGGVLQRVLDVGCGTAMYAAAFLKSGWDYYGVDISYTAIEEARDRAPAGTYRLHDFSSSPLPEWEGRFDCVFIRTVLIHVVDDELWHASLRHTAKQLSEYGKLVVVDSIPRERQSPATHVVGRTLDEYRAAVEALDMTLSFHPKKEACEYLVISRPAKP